MLVCRDITRLISESMDHSLPLGKRLGVRIHLIMCKFCARYERQLVLIRKTVHRLVTAEEKPEGAPGEPLSDEARERIKDFLRNE